MSVSETADTLLAVLSERFCADETLKTALLEAVSAGAAGVLPLRLDRAEQPPEIRTALYVRNTIPADRRSPEQTAERIIAALPEKKNRMGKLLIAGAAALAVLAGVLIWRAVPKEEAKPETAPVMAEEITIPDGLGLRLEDLQYIWQRRYRRRRVYFLRDLHSGPDAPVSTNTRRQRLGRMVQHRPTGTNTARRATTICAFLPDAEACKSLLCPRRHPGAARSERNELRTIEFYDCTVDRLDWFNSERLESARSTAARWGLLPPEPSNRSCGPNSASRRRRCRSLRLLSGQALQPQPRWQIRAIQMPPLAGCTGLRDLRLQNLPLENLDFLAGCDVYHLYLSSLYAWAISPPSRAWTSCA